MAPNEPSEQETGKDKITQDIPPNTLRKELLREAKERRRKLGMLVNKIGLRNSRDMTKNLAKQFKVVERTIRNDFNYIKRKWKPTEIQEIKITLQIARDKAINEALTLFAEATTNKQKVESLDLIMRAGKYYREELEAWGEKQKVAELHQFENAPVTINFVTHSNEDIKNDKAKNRNKNPGDINIHKDK